MCGLPWRVILRNNGTNCCDRKLLFGLILFCFCNDMFKLSLWFLSRNCSLFKLHGMSRRFILRKLRPYCSDGSMRSGLILSCIFNYVFKLYIGNIFIIYIFNELLQLSCGIFSGFDGIHCMYCLPRRIVLRNIRSH